MSENLEQKITGEWTTFRAPIKLRYVANCSFSSIEDTFLGAKKNGEFCSYIWSFSGSKGKGEGELEDSTEEGMLNCTETAVCNLSEFYWCSKRCSFSCYF